MKTIFCLIFIAGINSFFYAQDWVLEHEDERIVVYTKKDSTDNIKTYKAESYIKHPAESIFAVYTDFENYPEWFEELEQILMIDTTFGENYTVYDYYSVIAIPWPFDDRELVQSFKTEKLEEGRYLLYSTPLEYSFYNEDFVRVEDFYQRTELIDQGNGTTKILMEGKYDVGGNVPSWLINMFVVSGPMNAVESIENYLDNK